MKLSAIARDATAIEQGQWVGNIPDMEDLRLKVRGEGNASWRRMQSRLVASIPRAKRVGGIDPDEGDRVTAILLRDACLLDWENVTDDEGKPIPFSKDAANDLLTNPATRAFRDAVMWAATQVGHEAAASMEDQAGNSARASSGT